TAIARALFPLRRVVCWKFARWPFPDRQKSLPYIFDSDDGSYFSRNEIHHRFAGPARCLPELLYAASFARSGQFGLPDTKRHGRRIRLSDEPVDYPCTIAQEFPYRSALRRYGREPGRSRKEDIGIS